MGLGLIVGVAALGVISARAVVERRQQIGVLRAIGFQAADDPAELPARGVVHRADRDRGRNGLRPDREPHVISDIASQPAYSMVTLHVPWVNLTIVFTVVYLVALATSLAPAIRASRIYPAEALRYE